VSTPPSAAPDTRAETAPSVVVDEGEVFSLPLPEDVTEQASAEAPVVLERIPEHVGQILHGKASFYGKSNKFQGRRTANGERFDRRAFTAASNRFPLGVWAAVQRKDTGACVLVWINDRMHPRHKVRIVDLSHAAAKALGSLRVGVVDVEARQLRGAKDEQPARCETAFDAETPES
jgi:rare lipoprotein A (peptidoglycan hydrolase)